MKEVSCLPKALLWSCKNFSTTTSTKSPEHMSAEVHVCFPSFYESRICWLVCFLLFLVALRSCFFTSFPFTLSTLLGNFLTALASLSLFYHRLSSVSKLALTESLGFPCSILRHCSGELRRLSCVPARE